MISSVVHQFYQTRLTDEFVLNGNSALLKCLIPSFISDFVFVDAWISDDGEEYYADNADIGDCLIRTETLLQSQIPLV